MSSDAVWVKKGGCNGARGVITAGTNLLPVVDVCLDSLSSVSFVFILSNSVGTLKRKQQMM